MLRAAESRILAPMSASPERNKSSQYTWTILSKSLASTMDEETPVNSFQQAPNNRASSSRLPFSSRRHFLAGSVWLNSAIRTLSSRAFCPTHRPNASATFSELIVLVGTMMEAPPWLTKLAMMILKRSLTSTGETVLLRSNSNEEPFLIPPFRILSRPELPVENDVYEWAMDS